MNDNSKLYRSWSAGRSLRIGTRGSPLALHQTQTVVAALKGMHPGLETETVVIRTSGDWLPVQGERRLSEADGGKGQFAREIEEALLGGRVDIAVHSMKDMETAQPEGLVIRHMLPREDVRDCIILKDRNAGIASLDDFPQGATIGTASVRRRAFLLSRRPDLKIRPIRGNVQTRIDKLESGFTDAIVMAMAGLNRLGLQGRVDFPLPAEDFVPSAGQGAVGIEFRSADKEVSGLLDPVSCARTVLCVVAEKAALSVLDGSCHTPVGVWATLDEAGNTMTVAASLCALDGSAEFRENLSGAARSGEDAAELGRAIGEKMKAAVPRSIMTMRIAEDE